MKYVLSRNAGGRPTLQHAVRDADLTVTCCGIDLRSWSKVWMPNALGLMLCSRCKPHTRTQ